ncbi:MAG: hypothetical protein K2X82_21140 [Gemmataceae bacterium]|nr:hypothetical protein [Gemmataceae bacterium]
MRGKLLLGVGWLLAGAGAAAAQPPGYGFPPGGYGYGQGAQPYPGLNPANVMPNIYNPRTQPLSPYLNLFQGGNRNPAVNYYFGVRPGTIGGAGSIGGSPLVAQGGMRGPFFPQFATGADPGADPTAPPPANAAVLPPAGHPVVFGNTLGYFPGSVSQPGRRPGLTGVGASGTGGRR